MAQVCYIVQVAIFATCLQLRSSSCRRREFTKRRVAEAGSRYADGGVRPLIVRSSPQRINGGIDTELGKLRGCSLTDLKIFAGGMGKRMGIDLPKALIEVKNKTLLASSVENFLDAGIQEFVFMLGYQSDKIVPEIQRLHKEFGIDYKIQTDPYLDCGRIIALKQALNDNLIKKNEPSCIHYVDGYITFSFRTFLQKLEMKP